MLSQGGIFRAEEKTSNEKRNPDRTKMHVGSHGQRIKKDSENRKAVFREKDTKSP